MAEYRIRATGATMLEGELRQWAKDNNGPSWDQTTPEVLEALGADVVFEGPQATPTTPYQFSMRQGVEQQADGKWYTKYVLGPVFTDTPEATAAEQEAAYKAQKDAEQAKSVRADRNKRLAECDWVTIQAIDSSMDGFGIQLPKVWMDYRQALRDVPKQTGFPWTVDWPVAP